MLKRTAWIWAAGAAAWAVDGGVALTLHSSQHAALAFLMALLFLVAWLFYRGQKR